MAQLDETGFVFVDDKCKPYYVRMHCGSAWLFWWHPDKLWVSLRTVDQGEVWEFEKRRLSPEKAALYFNNP